MESILELEVIELLVETLKVIQTPIVILLLLIVLDYISGVAGAIVTHKVSSSVGIAGVIRKIMVLVVVTLSLLVDLVWGLDGMIVTSSIIAFIISESISILENAVECGVPIPDKLKELLDTKKED